MRRSTVSFARLLTSASRTRNPRKPNVIPHLHSRFYASQPEIQEEVPSTAPTWDESYRAKADEALFGGKGVRKAMDEDIKKERSRRLSKALLDAALMEPDEEEEDVERRDETVKLEDQMSLLVGIVGAPNAGKSCLTNCIVGQKIAAVSRKTHTTNHEVLGILTKGNTQICLFDTPGIAIGIGGHPQKTDVRARVESAWKNIDSYDLLLVTFDVHRHLTMRSDQRVIRLIKYLGAEAHPTQKRVLCMNKIDLVGDKKELAKVAEEFKDLPGYDRHFMISGLRGSGVKDLLLFMMEQAVQRPWEEEEPDTMLEETMKATSLQVVREKMLNHIHQEIPYVLEHRLMDWKELRDGSLRIEQHFVTQKPRHRQILVGKNGSMIGRIGVEANEELRAIFKRDVHLFLQDQDKISKSCMEEMEIVEEWPSVPKPRALKIKAKESTELT